MLMTDLWWKVNRLLTRSLGREELIYGSYLDSFFYKGRGEDSLRKSDSLSYQDGGILTLDMNKKMELNKKPYSGCT